MSRKPFHPEKLPLGDLDWASLVQDVVAANVAIAKFGALLERVKNRGLLLSSLEVREAELSSLIEGTKADVVDVLLFEDKPRDVEQPSVREVWNYRRAVLDAAEQLDRRPISLNLLRQMLANLLRGVRGKDQGRGEFRKTQNYIGSPGSTIEGARYIPPPPGLLMEALDNLEKYIHFGERDRLVQLAIIHAQFEVIHPFGDGNGRVGRMLVPLFMYEKRLLKHPSFYISEYFEKNRKQYYDGLLAVSENRAWEDWIRFFLKAISVQADENARRAASIMEQYDGLAREVPIVTGSHFSIAVLDAMFQLAVFTIPSLARRSAVSTVNTRSIVLKLVQHGTLICLKPGKGRRSSVYAMKALLDTVDSQHGAFLR